MNPTAQQPKVVFIGDRMVSFCRMDMPLSSVGRSITLEGGENPVGLERLILDFLHVNDTDSLFLIAKDADAAWSTFLENFVIVDAAGGLVLNEQGQLLMIHRYGKWDLPKGKLESDEEVVEGAKREVIEECGVWIDRVVRPLAPSHHTYVHKGRKCLKRTFWFEFSGGGGTSPQAEEGILAAEWLSISEVKRAMEESYSSIKSVVAAAFPDWSKG